MKVSKKGKAALLYDADQFDTYLQYKLQPTAGQNVHH
jgi:hypothetical protein